MASGTGLRYHLIDALRGVAALWVTLYHAHEGRHIPHLAEALPQFVVSIVFELGYLGVPIFFVISGFVIAHSIIRDRVNFSYFTQFTLRRSIRLDPPYWGSIILVVGLAWLSAMVQGDVYSWPNIGDVVAHLFYAQGILGIEHINLIYWTLCLEIQFYLTFCLLVALVQNCQRYTKNGFLWVFTPVALISLLWPTDLLTRNVYQGLFFPYWYAFLLGVFAYCSWQGALPRYFFYAYVSVMFVAAVFSEYSFRMGAVVTALLVHECALRGKLNVGNVRWLQFLGLISYSLYLTHGPITGASYFVLYKIMGETLLTEIVALGITTAICIVFAFAFWWMFERWSVRLSQRIKLHRGGGLLPRQ